MKFWFINIEDNSGFQSIHRYAYDSKDAAIEAAFDKRTGLWGRPISVQEASVCSDRLLLWIINSKNGYSCINNTLFHKIHGKNEHITLSEPIPVEVR